MKFSSGFVAEEYWRFDWHYFKYLELVRSHLSLELNIFTQSHKTVFLLGLDYRLHNDRKGCVVTSVNNDDDGCTCQVLCEFNHFSQDFSFAFLQLQLVWKMLISKSLEIAKMFIHMNSDFSDIGILTNILIHFKFLSFHMWFHWFILPQKLRSISNAVLNCTKGALFWINTRNYNNNDDILFNKIDIREKLGRQLNCVGSFCANCAWWIFQLFGHIS